MPAHHAHLVVGELARLEQHRIGNGDLAHVVQRRGHLDDAHLLLRQAQLLGDQPGHVRHALQERAGAGVAVLDGARQPRQGLAFTLLDLVHARQQPLLQRERALLDAFALLTQLQQVGTARAQFARTDRLDQEIDDARFQRRLADRLVADDGDQDDRDIAVARQPAQAARELQPVHAGHAVVQQQQIHAPGLAPRQRIERVAEIVDLQLRRDVLDDVAQHRPRGHLVIDNDDVQSQIRLFRPASPCIRRRYTGRIP